MSTNPTIRRALLSVSDKTGILELAQALAQQGVEILSTGGTAKLLADKGIPVKEVSAHTGFPEIMDGRVKTLHPKIHGGILARRDLQSHLDAMQEHGIGPIDLVAVNLYPFDQATAGDPDIFRIVGADHPVLGIGGSDEIGSGSRSCIPCEGPVVALSAGK